MTRTVRGRLILSYGVILLLLAISSVVAVQSAYQLRSSLSHVVNSDDRLEQLIVRRLTLMDDKETGLRGYLLTRDRRFLEPYTGARSTLAHLRAETRALVKGNPVLRHRDAELLTTADNWQMWANRVLSPLHVAGYRKLVAQQLEGKRLFDTYRLRGSAMLQAVSADREVHLQDSNAVASRETVLLIVIFAVALIAAGAITWFMTHTVTVPLLSLGRHAAAIGRGELHQTVEIHAPDEFQHLGSNMEQMRLQLISDRAEVQKSNALLERRVQERTRQLEASNAELESFSYSVSHDLRAPLRSIDGFGGALEEEFSASLPPEGRNYLSRIRVNTQRMTALIDDLLKLSGVARGELERTSVDLSAMARSILQRLQEQFPQRSVEWTIEDGVIGGADERLTRVALENLIGNAWKFTARTPRAHISFGQVPHRDGVYVVRDNGAGFDMQYADRLFGAFQRLHTSEEFDGTGIGLATVQRIVHRHGGEIWAESEPERGAAFYFTLAPGAVAADSDTDDPPHRA